MLMQWEDQEFILILSKLVTYILVQRLFGDLIDCTNMLYVLVQRFSSNDFIVCTSKWF